MNFEFIEDGKFPPFSTQNHLFKTTTALGSLTVSTTDISFIQIFYSVHFAHAHDERCLTAKGVYYMQQNLSKWYTRRERERERERDPWREITDLEEGIDFIFKCQRIFWRVHMLKIDILHKNEKLLENENISLFIIS